MTRGIAPAEPSPSALSFTHSSDRAGRRLAPPTRALRRDASLCHHPARTSVPEPTGPAGPDRGSRHRSQARLRPGAPAGAGAARAGAGGRERDRSIAPAAHPRRPRRLASGYACAPRIGTSSPSAPGPPPFDGDRASSATDSTGADRAGRGSASLPRPAPPLPSPLPLTDYPPGSRNRGVRRSGYVCSAGVSLTGGDPGRPAGGGGAGPARGNQPLWGPSAHPPGEPCQPPPPPAPGRAGSRGPRSSTASPIAPLLPASLPRPPSASARKAVSPGPLPRRCRPRPRRSGDPAAAAAGRDVVITPALIHHARLPRPRSCLRRAADPTARAWPRHAPARSGPIRPHRWSRPLHPMHSHRLPSAGPPSSAVDAAGRSTSLGVVRALAIGCARGLRPRATLAHLHAARGAARFAHPERRGGPA